MLHQHCINESLNGPPNIIAPDMKAALNKKRSAEIQTKFGFGATILVWIEVDRTSDIHLKS